MGQNNKTNFNWTCTFKKGEKDIKKIFRAVAVLSFFSITTRLLSFVYRVFLSRVLSHSMLGMYTIALSVFGIFNTLLASGTPLAVSRLVSTNSKNVIPLTKDNKGHSYVTAGLVVSASLAGVLALFVLVAKPLFNQLFTHTLIYEVLLTLIPAIITTGVYTSFRGYMYGKEKYVQVSVVELIEQALRMIFCAILMFVFFKSSSPKIVGVAFSLAAVTSTVLGIYIYFKMGGKLDKPKKHFKPVIKSSTPITTVRLVGSIMLPIAATILPLRLTSAGFTTEQALSMIGIMVSMTLPLLSIPSTFIAALSTALVPRVTVLSREKKFRELESELHTSINFTIVLTFLIIPIFAALGPAICQIIFNSSTAGLYLSYACWVMLPMNLTQLTTSILNSLGLEFKSFWVYIVSSLFMFAAILFLPQFIDIHSIIIGMGLSGIVSTCLNFVLIKRKLQLKHRYLKNIIILTCITATIALVTKWSFNLLVIVFPSIIAIGLASAISVIAYVLLLAALNLYDVKTIYFACYNKVTKKSKLNVKK